MRRSGLMSQRLVDIPSESRADVDVLWGAWIEEEVAKRVAHIGFAVCFSSSKAGASCS